MNLDTNKLLSKAEPVTKGRHGQILYIDHEGKELILKKQTHPKATTMAHKEWIFTKKAHSLNIAPKPLYLDKENNVFIREYVAGARLEYVVRLNHKDKTYMRKLFSVILDGCRALEKVNVYKPELTYPRKDILVTKENKPVFIDFERCTLSKKNKNVTQFSQYILRCDYVNPTRKERKKVYVLGKKYASSPTKKVYAEFKQHLLQLL